MSLSEEAFLASYDPQAFERPALTVDLVVLTVREGELRALVIQRPEHPFRGAWTLPGGFVGIEEGLEEAARRVLREKCGLSGVFVEQLYTFGRPDRDPRMRIVSVAHVALVDAHRHGEGAGGWARVEVPWSGETGGPVGLHLEEEGPVRVGFDHEEILGMAVKRIRGKLDYTPIGFQLLPERFTLRQLQTVHETVLGRKVNKDSFRRRMLATGQLEATGERERAVGHRPAELYRFRSRAAV